MNTTTRIPDMRQQKKKEPPNNFEAEQALLGAILVNNAAFGPIDGTGIQPQDFYEPIHRAFFEAMKTGISAGKVINPVTMKALLSPDLISKPIGDLTVSQYLARLAIDAVSVVMAPEFARAIIFDAQRRSCLSATEVAEVAAYHSRDESDFVGMVTEARDRLDVIVGTLEGAGSKSMTAFSAMDEALSKSADVYAGIVPSGLNCGIPEVNELTGRWQDGQLIVIGGGVKQGKSALAMQIAFEVAKEHPVLIYSGEMSRIVLTRREIARHTGISAKRQAAGDFTDVQYESLMAATQRHREAFERTAIIDRTMTLDALVRAAEADRKRRGTRLLVVDHVNKLEWEGRMAGEDEFKHAQEAMNILQKLAQRTGLIVVALVHLKRAAFQTYNGRDLKDRLTAVMSRRPTYHDLLGNVDKHADHAIITFQPRPIISGMEPMDGTADHLIWEDFMSQTDGRAELILSLSRHSEFPRRKSVIWNGDRTSYSSRFNPNTALLEERLL